MALFVSYSPYLSYAAWASTVTVPWKSGSARLHDQLTAGQPPELCRGPRLQRGCGASGLRVGLGRTRPRVVWWVPWAGGTGWGPSWLCCRFTRWCWASLVPRLVCFLGSRPVRSWSPWTQRGAELATSTGSVLQRLPCAHCWAHAPRGTLSRKHPSGCMQHLTLLVPKRGFPKGL